MTVRPMTFGTVVGTYAIAGQREAIHHFNTVHSDRGDGLLEGVECKAGVVDAVGGEADHIGDGGGHLHNEEPRVGFRGAAAQACVEC